MVDIEKFKQELHAMPFAEMREAHFREAMKSAKTAQDAQALIDALDETIPPTEPPPVA